MSKKSISVVIPNYNGKGLLKENLPPLFLALAKCEAEYEIIISDDASTDDSVEFLKNNYPSIKVIENKINRGFSPTINEGIKAANKDLVFALNSDVQLTEDYFLPQFNYFKNENTFGVMGRIIGLNDDKIQDGAKYPVQQFLSIKSTSNYILENPLEKREVLSLFLSGANALMDRIKLQEIGGYDELYSPFYVEDVDLSLTAWRLGWKSYFEYNSICRHPSSATISQYNKKRKVKIISLRNKILFHMKHLSGITLAIYKVSLFCELLTRSILFQSYFIEAYCLYLKRSRQLSLSRKKIESLFAKYKTRKSIRDVILEIKINIKKEKIVKF
jgi:GT2 family glycosyltransferase